MYRSILLIKFLVDQIRRLRILVCWFKLVGSAGLYEGSNSYFKGSLVLQTRGFYFIRADFYDAYQVPDWTVFHPFCLVHCEDSSLTHCGLPSVCGWHWVCFVGCRNTPLPPDAVLLLITKNSTTCRTVHTEFEARIPLYDYLCRLFLKFLYYAYLVLP